ncbi:MAG: putative aminopeptidase YsdC [Anaerolineae bacterium]|nr:putative aminopeptidase YsdC [Anaerolineae bacterium]
MKDLIKQLTEAYGPSGYEHAVRNIIRQHIAPHADSIEVDALGNLHAVKNGGGNGLTVMLAAHMDEIGLIVSQITDEGYARFSALGGVMPETLIGSRVVFTNGALAVINIDDWLFHERPDRSHRTLYLDFGVSRRQDVPVRVGDVAGFERPFVDLGQTMLAKSMDDRIGCAILVETLRRLENSPHRVHFVFTVQEEVGSRGAVTAAYHVHPDVSIAVDVTDSGDIPKRKNFEVKMGQGPAIKVMDRQLLAHPGLKRAMVETAKKHKIPHQLEILTVGSTDATAMQLAHEGSAAGGLAIPCRHVHTPSEMVSTSDVQHGIDLLLALLAGPIKLD